MDMTQFEYKFLEAPTKGFWSGKIDLQELTNTLNTHGRDGWEVVSTTDTNMHQGGTNALIILLKRKIDNL